MQIFNAIGHRSRRFVEFGARRPNVLNSAPFRVNCGWCGPPTGGLTTLGQQEGEVSPSAALPHFRTSCRAPLHRASEPLCAALL